MRKEIVHLEKFITMRIKLLIIGNCNNAYLHVTRTERVSTHYANFMADCHTVCHS